jgi:Cof subfamily protein (haloacid dehalogenase superfamily)
MKSLYISDLDGTLLGADGNLSAFSVEVLRSLLSNDVIFTVASARSVSSIQNVLAGLEFNLPVIEFNGAMVSDFDTGEHLFINSIDSSVAEDILSLVEDTGNSAFVSAFTGSEDRLYYSSVTGEGMKWYLNNPRFNRDRRLKQLSDIRESLDNQVICVNVTGRIENVEGLEAELRKQFSDSLVIHCLQDHYSPGFYWLTAHSIKASKAAAIKFLQDFTGTNDRELVVFGDNSNDIGMFKLADRAVAVSNAVPELKVFADEIIGSSNTDSVALYLKEDYMNRAE